MNFFSQAGDIAKGMMNYMNNNNAFNAGSDKENVLRKKLENCTYPDETKFVIEKAIKQVYHVYPFFDSEILMFTENGFQRRYLEVKGIIEVDIKGKNCKVDFNIMLPADYPRSSPFVRIVNRHPDYRVDPYYQSLQSKTDKSSYILSDKLNSCKNWHPSSSLVNVIIESYDMLKTRFPFSKPSQENSGKTSPWDSLYNNNQAGFNNNQAGFNNNNMGGGGFTGNNNNNKWGPGGNWQQTGAGNNNAWNNNNTWGNKNNNWGNPGTWGNNNVPTGGMGSLMGAGNSVTANIASGQRLAGKQKQSLQQIGGLYIRVLQKNQHLDATRQSLQIEESTLRNENFEMANFLSDSEQQGAMPDLTNFVKPSNEFSEQILQLLSSLKAREDCIVLLENKFNQEQLSLEDFTKQLRKIEESRFEERVLLQKCVRNSV